MTTVGNRCRRTFAMFSIVCLYAIARSSTASATGSARFPVAGSLIGPNAAQSSVVVVSSEVDNVVGIFSPGGTPVATINADYPSGVALDRFGNVYFGAVGGVMVYKDDYKTLLLTLKTGAFGKRGTYPNSVAVDRSSGTVAVTTPINGPTILLFYKAGSERPCNALSLPVSGTVWGAFDAAGRYYVSGQEYIGLVTGPCAATSIERLTTAKYISNQAVKITPAGNVAFFVDEVKPSYTKAFIYTYAPPVDGSLGAPITITPLLHYDVPAFNGFAFTPDGTSLFLANYGKGALKYAYPAGGLPIQPIKLNDAYDVIVGP